MPFDPRTKDQPTPQLTGDSMYDHTAVPSDTVWAKIAQSP